MVKRGDTLIEVTLAVGIFSMIAVAVVAIMSNGTSETQTALETTLAREEIDIQAEALRFIQASASTETSGATGTGFRELWNEIKDNSIDLSDLNSETKNNVLNFAPNDCVEPYQDLAWLNNQHAFFIDPSKLSGNDKTSAFVKTYERFHPTETYPRITEKSSGGSSGKSQAEGIFVVGVKGDDSAASKDYYDFYIRTCWYGSNADRPSTISTVIRLLGE